MSHQAQPPSQSKLVQVILCASIPALIIFIIFTVFYKKPLAGAAGTEIQQRNTCQQQP